MTMTAAPQTSTTTDTVAELRHARRRGRRRTTLVNIALMAAVFVAAAAHILLGRYTVTIPDFFRIISGETIPGATFIVMQDKLPRTVIGILVGVAFGAAGALLQRVLRNPLASPDLLGISHGASTAAVVGIVFFGVSGYPLAGLAFLGASGVVAVIYLVTRADRLAGGKFILVGLAFAASGQAVISYLMSRTNTQTASESVRWLAGSLNNSTWQWVVVLLAAAVVLVPLTVAGARALTPVELGDDTATAIGAHALRSRITIIVAATALCAAATAAVGPLSFVAFLSAPIARRLVRGAAVTTAALVAALLVIVCDFAATNLFGDFVVPVGVVTGAIGAPALIFILIAANKAGRAG